MRRILQLPLTIRVPVLVSLLMIALGTVASERVLTRLAELQERQLREMAEVLLDGLSVAVMPAVIRRDVWETFDVLERSSRRDEGLRMGVALVVLADGSVLAASDPARFRTGSRLSREMAGAPLANQLRLTGDAEVVQVRRPLIYQGERIAELHAELDVRDLLNQRREALWALAFGNLAATLLLAALGYLMVRRMLKPVGLLATYMADGDDDGPRPVPERLIPAGGNEFAGLLRRYNALVEAERERRETLERLAEHQRLVSLGRLASSVAHEINNPLAGLLTALDTMKRHGNDQSVLQRSVELLERGLVGIRDVVQAMLEVHRPPRAPRPLAPSDFDDLRLLIAPEIHRRAHGLEWQVDFAADDGKSLDSAPVRQIGLNLLLNASAAAGRGGRVGFYVAREGDVLCLAVEDSGPGLGAEALRRLGLDNGAKTADSATGGEGRPDGQGIGLRVVRGHLEALRGRISVARVEKEGGVRMTRIEVRLPLSGTRRVAA